MWQPVETARQLAYVTNERDFDDAVKFWLDAMRVGPFYMVDIRIENQTFRGVPTAATGRAALTMFGDVQIEILCATNDEPSPFTEWIEHVGSVPRGGLFHHFLIDTHDFDSTYNRLFRSGCLEGLRGSLPDGREIAYLDGRDVVGSYVEVIERTELSAAVTSAMGVTCRNWEGSEPLRDYLALTNSVLNDLHEGPASDHV